MNINKIISVTFGIVAAFYSGGVLAQVSAYEQQTFDNFYRGLLVPPWVVRGIPGLQKQEKYYLNAIAESTPVVLNNKLLLVYFVHKSNISTKLVIHDVASNRPIKQINWPHGLGSAIVDKDRLFIFGTSEWSSAGNSIHYLELDDTFKQLDEGVAYGGQPDAHIYNTSVTKSGDQYVMAVEVQGLGATSFHTRFLMSEDLKKWKPVGGFYSPYDYAACPKIYFDKGWYYLLTLQILPSLNIPEKDAMYGRYFVTKVTRSKNLIDFQEFMGNKNLLPETKVLVPDMPDEQNNSSDIDFVEFNNKVHIFYNVGTQEDRGHLKYATYDGTVSSMLTQFFEP